jgi:signal transduction histidine kinase
VPIYLSQLIRLLLFLSGLLPCVAAPVNTDGLLASLTTTLLEQRLAAVDSELAQLANYSLRSGVGAIGYRSAVHSKSDATEWVQIELGQNCTFDQIVLVPSIWRGTQTEYRADGFPEEFRIIAGGVNDSKGKVVASFSIKDQVLPRIAPLVIACPNTVASWVRLEATKLSPRAWDGMLELELAEILVFKGQENIALHRPVIASSAEPGGGAREVRFLVDGFTPYLMDAAQGEQSIAMVSGVGIGNKPWIELDLGSILPINRLHFHSADLSDTVPQANDADYGIPRRMLVEGAKLPDFSDAVPLAEYRAHSIYETGPIIILSFPEANCRYVRLTAVNPFINDLESIIGSQIGIAEIEVFSKGCNVAIDKKVTASFSLSEPTREFSAITDGRNLSGNILPIRDWMDQLAQRHNLEIERPLIVAELNHRYARQKTILKWLVWLTVLLAAGIAITILIARKQQSRKIAEIRERFAADLHDELGANLHTMRLLGDVALSVLNSPERLKTVLLRNQDIAERTNAAVRRGINLYQLGEPHRNLPEDMLRSAERVLADVEPDISIMGRDILNRLPSDTRADLFLFFKESLVNISRHSGATQFSIDLVATEKCIRMVISDNGCGIPDSDSNGVPSSLKRRARLLGAQVSAGKSNNGGASITLAFKPKRLAAKN